MFLGNEKKRKLFGPAGTPGTKGPRSRDLTGQDLETLKVLWSRGPGTKEVQKVPRTMESLLATFSHL